MTGLSTSTNISFGSTFVAGRNLVPRPAAGKTAFRIVGSMSAIVTQVQSPHARSRISPRQPRGRSKPAADTGDRFGQRAREPGDARNPPAPPAAGDRGLEARAELGGRRGGPRETARPRRVEDPGSQPRAGTADQTVERRARNGRAAAQSRTAGDSEPAP